MTDMEKLRKAFDEIGIAYEMSDDSEESSMDEVMNDKDGSTDTVVILNQSNSEFIAFHFRRNGKFRELFIS